MRCEVKAAQAALRVAKSAAGSKSAVSALGAVKVTGAGGVATMEAKDGEIGVRRTFAASDAGELLSLVAIPKLEKTLSVMKGEVTFEQGKGSGLVVSAGSRKVTIPGESLTDFDWPAMPFEGGELILSADGAALAGVIGRVAPYASTDQTRPVLTGVAIDSTGALVGCDSYRLGVFPVAGIDCDAVKRLAPTDSRTINVPARAWTLAAKGMKGADVTVSLAGLWAIIDTGEAVWTARRIDGTYPNWSQLMPDDFEVTATLANPLALRESAEAAGKLLHPKTPMRIGLNGGLTVRAFDHGGVDMTENVPALIAYATAQPSAWTTEGDEPVEIGVTPAYLVDALKSLEGGEVTLNLITPLRPALLESAAGRSLLMPVRLNV
jgi:DNA polymerase-3 subunit beta